MHTFEERGRATEWTTVLTPFLVDIRFFLEISTFRLEVVILLNFRLPNFDCSFCS